MVGSHLQSFGFASDEQPTERSQLATFEGDAANGMPWIHKSAEAGFAPGMMMWSFVELSGKHGVAQNKADAQRWMEKAARAGNSSAQTILAQMDIAGTFGHTDVQTGIQWLRQAARQGYPRAEGTLGVLLVTGDKGVAKNPAEGIEWAKKAVAQHSALGYYALGYAYERGEGNPVDAAKAWYNFAAAQRIDTKHELKNAGEQMSLVATKLSPSQIHALQAEVAQIQVPKKNTVMIGMKRQSSPSGNP